jgi:periplasmic divalent cation tolerance protein
MDTRTVLVLTTVDAALDATALARTLVDERLVACVNALAPVTSVYRWKGNIEVDREQQLLMKTSADRVPALEQRLRELHPYDVPEFLVLSVETGSAAYLAWVAESTKPVA